MLVRSETWPPTGGPVAKARVVLGSTELETERWYSYREGSWVSSEEALDEDRLLRALMSQQIGGAQRPVRAAPSGARDRACAAVTSL